MNLLEYKEDRFINKKIKLKRARLCAKPGFPTLAGTIIRTIDHSHDFFFFFNFLK